MKTDTPRTIKLEDYSPSPFLIETTDLDIALHPTETIVKSRLKIRHNPASDSKATKLELTGENLELDRIAVSGRKLAPKDYKKTKTGLTINKIPDRSFTLEITTKCNPEGNKALQGLYRSGNIYCTQCEPEGFRRITYFLDRPDVLSVYTTRLEADRKEAPTLLSNGNLIESGKIEGTDRHFAIWHDPHPKPSYLFALVGGRLACVKDKYKTKSGRKVELRIYCEPGKKDRCGWAMDSLKRSMKWDEKRFGREYDLDIFMIVAVADFNMGAMENKGLNIFNDKLILARPDTATDADYASVEGVIAHEYFHNWTGNRITCRDWFQLCLKEGLTVFRDQEFTSDERSRTVKRIQDVRILRAYQFPEDGGPLSHPVRPESYIEINNFYTTTVYKKGAEICRMMLTILGRKGFRKGMDLYFERHDGEAAVVEDFVTAMEDANGVDLSHLKLWYSQAGTPELVCSLDYDARKKEALLKVNQINRSTPGQTKKKPLHIPLAMGLLSSNGQDIPLKIADGKNVEEVKDGLIHITKREQTFRFTDVPSLPTPSLLRGFSAPVKMNIDLSERDMEFLMANDSDLYNRWQAAQTYSTRTLIQMVEAVRKGKRSRKGGRLAKSLGLTLSDESLEPAYRAEFLKLPTESDLAREIGQDIDPAAIHKARLQLLSDIASELHDLLVDVYKKYEIKGRYSPSAKSTGKRSLRNVALLLLSCTNDKKDIKRVADHYKNAKNMTDKTAALAVLSNLDCPERIEAFDDFYNTWKSDHLVIDKWFAFQSASSLPDTLDTVKKLMKDPAFSIKTPNKVRSVVAAFAQSNPVNFNRPDGKGYAFVADTLLEIDKFNPQIAARLMGSFKSWRMLEPKRRNLAKQELMRVADNKSLSKDTYEIVTKTLG